MKKIFQTILLLFVLCIVGNNVCAQQFRQYYYLKLDSSIIRKALQNGKFEKFAFRLKTNDDVYYYLEAIAIDTSEDKMPGSPFNLETISSPPSERLGSHFRSNFFLTRQMMDSVGIDGTFNLFFSPRPFVARNGRQRAFVMYLLDKKAHHFTQEVFPPNGLNLNPSPPRNS